MKRRIKDFMLGLLALVVMFGGFCFASYIENHYTMRGQIINYGGQKCFEDEVGEVWSDDRFESFNIDDKVEVQFNIECTENNRLDDSIKKIKLLKE